MTSDNISFHRKLFGLGFDTDPWASLSVLGPAPDAYQGFHLPQMPWMSSTSMRRRRAFLI